MKQLKETKEGENMKKIFKKEIGITLVALVITIIILVILAGISISALTNQGLFTQTQNAKKQTELAKIKEQMALEMYETKLDQTLGNGTQGELKEILEKYFENVPETLPEDLSTLVLKTKKEYGGYEIKVSEVYSGKTIETPPAQNKVEVTEATTHTENAITYTWNELSEIAKLISNNSEITNDTLEVKVTLNGETKILGVGDTTTVDEKTVRILGFNHDTLTNSTAYGTATATGKAGISFEYVDFLSSSTQMNSYATNSGGWGESELRSTLNSTTYNSLSIKDKIKQVNKEFIQTYDDANSKTTSSDYLWLLSCGEIWDNGYNGGVTRGYAIATEGNQYKYYKANLGSTSYSSGADITIKSDAYGAFYWRLRSPFYMLGNVFCAVGRKGEGSTYGADKYIGLAPGFNI